MSKRICFVSLSNLYLTPYINKYTDLIDNHFDIIYWNRHNLVENIKAENIYSFSYSIEDNVSRLSKFIGYLKFRKFALKVLEKTDYDYVILLQTSICILLKSLLFRKYKRRYILDIRDYTYEKNLIFFKTLEKVIKTSALTVISSKGYKKFLPTYNYVIVHNNVKIDKEILNDFSSKDRQRKALNISFIGLVRFLEQNKKVIMKFKNDYRFVIRFIGKNANLLKDFCDANKIYNVELIDQFPPEKTLQYYYDTDIINNLYGNNSPLLEYALSNKLYYAAKLKIPILVCENTYMEEVSRKYKFGYTFDLNDPNACDKLYDYYNSIDWDVFDEGCNRFNQLVDDENSKFMITIKKILE